jgi:hypothetical protein
MKKEIQTVTISQTGGSFDRVDDAAVIIETKSYIQKQVGIYSRGGYLFAGIGGGFVILKASKGTSSPSYKWIEIIPLNNTEFKYLAPHAGYLELVD